MILLFLILAGTTISVEPGESIQNALDSAVPGDTVLVMPGIHVGTGTNLAEINGTHNGVVLLGDAEEPSSVVLSGDNLTGSIIRIDGMSSGPVDSTTVITGLKFSGGNAVSEPFGGALYTSHASPVVEFCLFTECTADNGGAIYSWKGAPQIRFCLFSGNECQSAGGAIYLYSSNGLISHCRFQDNTSWDDGGGVFCYYSSPLVFNCLFSGGYAHDDGGGIYCYALSDPEILFCTFSGNFSLNTGSAVYFRVNSSPEVSHCIATANEGPAFYIQDGGSPVFSYNCSWGNPDGNYGNLPDPTGTAGNISVNPLLTGDMFLSQIAAGQPENSPCVDAGGDFSVSYGLELAWTRTDSVPDSSTVDMGFHHGPVGNFQSNPQQGAGGEMLLFPNPTSSSFTLSYPPDQGWDTVEVFDFSGRRVLQQAADGSGSHTVSIEFQTGIYFVRMVGSESSVVKPVTILRD